jgi:polar amino acid transport system substrate-binding protein
MLLRPLLKRIIPGLALLCLVMVPHAARAVDDVFIPQFFDLRDRVTEPDPGSTGFIRFLTDDDFPPLNMRLPNGDLGGFNIDLARLICEELKAACTIQPRRWDTLPGALNKDRSGDAIIAALAINARSREAYDFSRIYLRTPARFVARSGDASLEINPAGLAGKTVAVLARSAHQAFIKDLFSKAVPIVFDDLEAARKALEAGKVDLVFADGLSNAVWLAGASGSCCGFVGGPYLESRYFGEGIGIAFRKGAESANLRKAVDFALMRLAASGQLGDLYLKYFPVGFF